MTNRNTQAIQRRHIASDGEARRPSMHVIASSSEINSDGRMPPCVDEPYANPHPMRGSAIPDAESNFISRSRRELRELQGPPEEITWVDVALLLNSECSIGRRHREMPPPFVVGRHLAQPNPGGARE